MYIWDVPTYGGDTICTHTENGEGIKILWKQQTLQINENLVLKGLDLFSWKKQNKTKLPLIWYDLAYCNVSK